MELNKKHRVHENWQVNYDPNSDRIDSGTILG
jgi:hypothetical protein